MANPIETTSAKLQLPAEVIGSDVYGQQFIELTQTLSIYRSGATIRLENGLGLDSEVIVRNPETNDEAIAFVVGQIRKDKSGYVYGVTFLDPSANLWHLQFPPIGAAKPVQLECKRCHSVCALPLSDIEMEVFKARQELTRPCDTCKTSRTWKATDREATEKQPEIPPGRNPIPQSTASSGKEKRKHRRTRMRMTACVRLSFLEDVVACEDISKGGFRFTSRKEYPEGTRVEVSIPYTRSSTNMFSPAYIVRCKKLPDGQYQHGVCYAKTSESMDWEP